MLEPVALENAVHVDPEGVVGPQDGTQAAVVDRHLVVLHVASGRRVLLNASAALVFTGFDRPRRVSEVIDQLADETGADRGELTRDVLATVDQLVSQGVLVSDDVSADRSTGTELPTGPSPEVDPGPPRATPPADDRWTLTTGAMTIGSTTVEIRSRHSDVDVALARAVAGLPTTDSGEAAHRIDLLFSASADATVSLVVDGDIRRDRLPIEQAIGMVFDEFDALVVDHTSGLRFHAGAVERDGQVVIIAGQSGHGKSTLTAALVQAGWCYLTDEVVIVDPATQRVAAYARPFDLDARSLSALDTDTHDLATGRRKNKVYSSRFGANSSGGQATMLVVLTGEPNTETPVQSMASAEAVMALLPLTFQPTFDSPDALQGLASLCEVMSVVRLARAPITEMVQTIDELLMPRES